MWFRVDDGFYDHPKVLVCDPAALGLWVRAGSYAGAKRTDGLITSDVVRAVLHARPRSIDELVDVGLWDRDGLGGWVIHDFLHRNPSRAELDAADAEREAGRAAARERMRARRAAERRDREMF